MTEPSRGSRTLTVEKRWTISNVLSVSRIFLTIPIVILILEPGSRYRGIVIVLMFAGALTDFLDGLLARMLDQVTDFGRLLDPAADKVCIIAIAAALVAVGDVPIWYAVLVALRDVLIVAGSLQIIARRKMVVQSVWAGKWTVAFIAAYLILATLRINSLSAAEAFFLYFSAISIFVSLAVYIRMYMKYMTESRRA